MRFRLVGFNCRRYDNHILYARLMGYTNEQLYNLSQKIINGSPNCFFGEAYNVSYTDVYDFASAGNKKSLKKLEIEMGNLTDDDLKKKGFSDEKIRIIKAGTHHQELGLPWDQPVPEELWIKVAEYCDNDVIATEAAFNYLEADWTARQILADLAEMTVNDTTNSLTTRIIFGNNRKPQPEFHYRNLAEPVESLDKESMDFLKEACPKITAGNGKIKKKFHSNLRVFFHIFLDMSLRMVNPHIEGKKWARADLLRAFLECMEMQHFWIFRLCIRIVLLLRFCSDRDSRRHSAILLRVV